MSETISPSSMQSAPDPARLTRLAHFIGEDTFGLPAATVAASLKALRIADLFPSVKDYGRGPLRDDAEEIAAGTIVALGGARTIAEVVPAWDRLSNLRATKVSSPLDDAGDCTTQDVEKSGPSLLGTLQLALSGRLHLDFVSLSQNFSRAGAGIHSVSASGQVVRRVFFFGDCEPLPVDVRFEIGGRAIERIADCIKDLRG